MTAVAHARPARRHGHSAPRGQFFTPEPVARFLWQALSLFGATRPDASALDLAAGDGVLLDVGCRAGCAWAARSCGLEIDAGFVAGRQARNPRVEAGDGLFDRPSESPASGFDIVVGNPPFGRSRDILSDAQWLRLGTDRSACAQIWGPAAASLPADLRSPAGSWRVEELFLQRALERVAEGGWVAYIVPDSLLSNRRGQRARDWIGARARLVAAAALPASAFRRPGLNAHAHLILLQRGDGDGRQTTPMLERRASGRGQLPAVLDGMLADLRRLRDGGCAPGGTKVAADDLRQARWDTGYWVGRSSNVCSWQAGLPDRPLGAFVELLTYGPIVTGSRARHVAHGVATIRQGDFTDTGLRRPPALRVEPGSAHDPPRSRVRRGDLLMPRSGSGALGRNRVAVYDDDEPANIGCFVDLIRLRELNPYYAWIFLRSRPGWGQIRCLINGVGTPNISFAEIRSLRVPLLPAVEQADFEVRYRRQVLPLHLQGLSDEAARRRAQDQFQRLVARLEARLGIVSGAGGTQL